MGSARQRREKAKRAVKRRLAKGPSPPERSPQRYHTYFFIRASHARNNKERGLFLDRFDTIQIPDVIRRVPKHRAGTRITKRHAARKRTIFKKAAKRRGLKTRIHNMILYTRAEMVGVLAGATTEGEGFVVFVCLDTDSASPEFAGCTLNRQEFWGDVVDIAVRGHAAVSVVDVFEDPVSQGRAWQWAKGILQELVDIDVPMAGHFFLRPMFGCGDEGPGSERWGSDSDKGTGADVAWPNRYVGGPPIQSRLTVNAHDSVAAKVACVVAKLSAIVTACGDEPHENVDPMIQAIGECLRSWDRNQVVEYEPVPADGLEHDADTVREAFEMFACRGKMVAYAKKVKKSSQEPEEPDEGDSWRQETDDDDEPDLPTVPEPPGRGESASASANDEAHGRHSSKDFVRELVDSCEKTANGDLPHELKDLQRNRR
eukprot:g20739.t1